MFTGIVTAMGRLGAVKRGESGADFVIEAGYKAIEIGESIAIDGVCLTVVEVVPGGFLVQATAETLGLTTLGHAQAGQSVNLERALSIGDRLGGHIVSGHVDGVGAIRSVEPIGDDAVRVYFGHPTELGRFIARKGSIAIDGVSLTINGVGDGVFDVVLIPHTRAVTSLGKKGPGDPVNLEIDVVARYVLRALEVDTPSGGPSGSVMHPGAAGPGASR
jgi:riboflavin synthase